MNYIEPLEINDDYYQGNLITIHVGEFANQQFIKAMQDKAGTSRSPEYMPPIGTDVLNCAWYVALAKNVKIAGKLPADKLRELIDLCHKYGAWSVVGIDTDDELHLVNAEVFRSAGIAA